MDEMTPDAITEALRAGVESLKTVVGAVAGCPVGFAVVCVIYDPKRKEDLRIAGTYRLKESATVLEDGAKAVRKSIAASKRRPGPRLQ